MMDNEQDKEHFNAEASLAAAQPEDYQITAEELLTIQLLEARVGKARSDLQLAAQSLQVFQNNLAGKYSEHGKYTLTGEVDLQTRKGTRVLVTE